MRRHHNLPSANPTDHTSCIVRQYTMYGWPQPWPAGSCHPREHTMFARVAHVQAKPEKIGEVVALYTSSVMPVLQQLHGFKGTYLLTDPDTGKGMSITLWETEADRLASDSEAALHGPIVQVMPLLAAPPVVLGFDAIEVV
ncbi:hypothetical protein F2P46_19625 [Massilia sp. CCM 8734]|nr:hypothetical protein [Massilia sp. CCM 8734]